MRRNPVGRSGAGAADASAIPAHPPAWTPWSPGDSEQFHPAEPDPALDGPAALYAGTIPTSARIDAKSAFPLTGGGAIEIDHLTGPANPKYLRAPHTDEAD